MTCDVGQRAPAFSVRTDRGKLVNMNLQPIGSLTLDGQCAVLLVFGPPLDFAALEEFEAKMVKIVGVTRGEEESVGYPLIRDPDLTIAAAYGAAADGAERSAVLVSRDGIVEQVWRSVGAALPETFLAAVGDPPPPPEPYKRHYYYCGPRVDVPGLRATGVDS